MAYNPLLAHHDDDHHGYKDERLLGRKSLGPKWWRNCLEPTTEFNGKQYCWILQSTVMTCCASFGVSYLVGYLVIADDPKPNLDDMLLNYLATAFMTALLNWLIGGSLMSAEVLLGRVAVIDPRELDWWPKEVSHDMPFTGRRWWLTPSDLVLEPSYYHCNKTWGGCCASFLQRFVAHITRSLPWIVCSIGISVPIMYGFSYFVYGQHNYNSYPQPQIMTAVQALLISLFTIPIWAKIVLANLGSKLVHDPMYIDYVNDIDPTGANVA